MIVVFLAFSKGSSADLFLKFISIPIAYVNSWQPNWIGPWPHDAGIHRARQGKARLSDRRDRRIIVIAKWICERVHWTTDEFFADPQALCNLVILGLLKMRWQRRVGNRVSANHDKSVRNVPNLLSCHGSM